MYKCSIVNCDNQTTVWYCEEHTRFLSENKTYKAYVCKYCKSIIKLEKSDKMIVEEIEDCLYCDNNTKPFFE